MNIAIASDHGGFELKKFLVNFLKKKSHRVEDLGCEATDSVDYPDYAQKVAERVSDGRADAGVLVCGTGIGMCMAANKFKNIRAAVVSEAYSARMAKEHNNANILCLGGRVLNPAKDAKKIEEIVSAWLNAKYEGGRHDRRLEKIRSIENS